MTRGFVQHSGRKLGIRNLRGASAKSLVSSFLVGWMFFCFCLTELSSYGLVRYAIYLTPIVILLVYTVCVQKIEFDPVNISAVFIYMAAVLPTFLNNTDIGFFWIRDFLIIIVPFSVFIFKMNVSDKHIKGFLLSLIAAIFLPILAGNKTLSLEVDFIASKGILESSYGLTIGAIAVYFIHKRDWRWGLIALVFTFISFKRVAFGGIVLAGLIPVLLRADHFLSERRTRFACVLAFAVLVIVGLNMVFLFEYGVRTLFGDVSVDRYALGRYAMAKILLAYQEMQNVSFWMFGGGPGSAQALVAEYYESLEQPHNDFMKINFEYGFLGQLLIYVMLYLTIARTKIGSYLFLYQGIMFLTDNTFIYAFHNIAILAMVRAAIDMERPTCGGAATGFVLTPSSRHFVWSKIRRVIVSPTSRH